MALKPNYTSVDRNQLPMSNFVVASIASDPGSPVEGQFWYNSTSDVYKGYANGSVVTFGSGSGTVTSVTAGDTTITIGGTATNPTVAVDVSVVGGQLIFNDGTTSISTAWSGSYTQSQITAATAGLTPKGSTLAATTTTLPAYTYANGSSGVGATLTGNSNGALSAQDGVTLTSGQLLLVKNETGGNQPYNGIYVLSTVGDGSNPYVLTRATNFNSAATIVPNSYVFVSTGTTLHDTGWILNLDTAAVVGTTNIVFSQFSGAGTYTAGNGITITGQSIAVKYDDSSIGIVSTNLAVKAGGITNAMLAGSIADTKLSTITTSNKVSGSAVQLGTSGGLSDSTGLIVNVDGSTITKPSGVLGVPTGGITATQLASGSVTPAKLANKYAANFANTDFSANVLTIAAATHGLGATQDLFACVRNSSKQDVNDGSLITYNTNGDVTVTVDSGMAFSGRIVITA